jgi:chaperone BCS1
LLVYDDNFGDIIKKVSITVNKSDISIKETFNVFFKKVKETWNSFIKKLESESNENVRKYIYDSCGYWNFLGHTEKRNKTCLFLRKGVKDRLLSSIESFLKPETRADYAKFNKSYKYNVLLYGVPGTGKTSTCLTVASHINTNVGIIPISKNLDDCKLVTAINNVKKRNCKVIVIEDIDCLFHDRKAHDTLKNSLTLSGLLNCMDGLYRNDGIIVFLTTNNIEVLDEALIRSSRIDLLIKYDYADKYQTQECFNYYFPNKSDDFENFYNCIAHKEYTVSNLQEYFFKYRFSPELLTTNIKEFFELINYKDVLSKDKTSLYI